MNSLVAVIIAAALAENIVLTKMLGLCPFAGLSRRTDVAVGVGLATCAVLAVASFLAFWADAFLLADFPLLRPLVFITAASAAVAAAELIMRLFFPRMHRALGLYLPLIATNCAVLGAMLIAVREFPGDWLRATLFGFGAGLGFMLAVIVFATLRERIVESRVPQTMRGAPLAMITAGIMALALSALP